MSDILSSHYDIPLIYSIFHLLLGYSSFYYINVAVLFFIYQLYQYCLGFRFFILSNVKWVDGNTFVHTLRKCLEFGFGGSIASITYYMFV